ncbi:hypothetical protein V2J09_016765 [Rumex salicifolius]
MGFRLPYVISNTKKFVRSSSILRSNSQQKGHLAVYVGGVDEHKTRYVVPLAYLNHPLFQDMVSHAEEEYGFTHPMGGLTIPCEEQTFVDFISQLRKCKVYKYYCFFPLYFDGL